MDTDFILITGHQRVAIKTVTLTTGHMDRENP